MSAPVLQSLISFQPQIDVGIRPGRPQKQIIDLPVLNRVIENPKPILNEIDEIISRISDLRLPTLPGRGADEEIQAARMIVIRRKKMKKHKLKKLRKRMKYAWAKIRQRRELRREKEFQAGLVAQIKEAEKFSAEAYVAEKLEKVNANPLPRYWNGKRLPQFIIKDLVEEDKAKKLKLLAKRERAEKIKNWKL